MGNVIEVMMGWGLLQWIVALLIVVSALGALGFLFWDRDPPLVVERDPPTHAVVVKDPRLSPIQRLLLGLVFLALTLAAGSILLTQAAVSLVLLCVIIGAATMVVIADALWPDLVCAKNWFVREWLCKNSKKNWTRLLRFCGGILLVCDLIYFALRLCGVCEPCVSTLEVSEIWKSLLELMKDLNENREMGDPIAALTVVPAFVAVLPRAAPPKQKPQIVFAPTLFDLLAKPPQINEAPLYTFEAPRSDSPLSDKSQAHPNRLLFVPRSYDFKYMPKASDVEAVALGLAQGAKYELSQIKDFFETLRSRYQGKLRHVLVVAKSGPEDRIQSTWGKEFVVATDKPIAAMRADVFEERLLKRSFYSTKALVEVLERSDARELEILGFTNMKFGNDASTFDVMTKLVKECRAEAMIVDRRTELFVGILNICEIYNQLVCPPEAHCDPAKKDCA